MFRSITNSTSKNLSAGGTISGDVTIDGDLTVSGSGTYTYDEQIDGQVWIKDSTTSSATQGGHLRLFSDDGAVMASGHRLGVIEFGGAEDTSSTITVGARIEALTDATWSASENGADMVFYTTDGDASQSERMRITSAGNVNIGSASSAIQATGLHVATGGAGVLGNVVVECSVNATTGPTLHFAKSRGSVGSKSAINTAGGDILGSIVFTGYDGSLERYGAEIQAISVATSSGSGDMPADLAFFTTPDGTASVVERMRIDDAGRVGIGNSALETWKTDMSVLQIGGDGSIAAKTTAAAGNDFFIARNAYWDSTNDRWEYMSTNGDDEAERLVMANGTYAFDLTGTAGADDAAITFTTALKLDSNSRISLSNNDSGTGNTIFGKSAGASLDAGSNYNVFIGEAVSDATMNDATYNVGVGYHSLGALTTGDDNVAIGNQALLASTTTSDCVAIGSGALTAVNSDDANGSVAIGRNAGLSITSGQGNIAIGHQALDAEDDGDYNTAVGHQALTSQTGVSGSVANTALGFQSGMAITKGRFSIALGASALRNEDVGDGTVAVGFESLYTQNSDSDNETTGNVGVGYQSGYYNVTGTNNTWLGHKAGFGASGQSNSNNAGIGKDALLAITTGGSNVAVGASAGRSLTTGENNVAVGKDALYYGTTETDDNIAIGKNSMAGNFGTAAVNDCIAIGSDSLDAVLTPAASGSVAIGKSALSANTAGLNIAIGFQALAIQTDGTHNVAIGYQSLDAADSGESQNVAIGSYSGGAINDASSDNNVLIGHYAGQGGAANMNSCVAVGSQAMDGTGTISSTDNVAIGLHALGGSWSGGASTKNIAIGSYALDAAMNGAYGNIAIGYDALGALTHGDSNIAIGAYMDGTYKGAMDANTTGSECIAIGSGALMTANEDDNDGTIAIGYGACRVQAGTGGSQYANATTAVGYKALTALTTGTGNTAVGYLALATNVDGSKNTAVGYKALYDFEADTANHGWNTALGDVAGENISTGTTNISIGHASAPTLTTGDANTILGTNADVSASGAANQIVLGYNATGVRDNSVTLGNSSVKTIVIPEQCAIGGSSYTTMADDATITVIDTNAGACMVYVYDATSGGGGVFFCTYSDAAVKVAGSSNTAATDSDGNLCVYKSTSSHDVIVKNRLGATRNISIIVVGAQPNP